MPPAIALPAGRRLLQPEPEVQERLQDVLRLKQALDGGLPVGEVAHLLFHPLEVSVWPARQRTSLGNKTVGSHAMLWWWWRQQRRRRWR